MQILNMQYFQGRNVYSHRSVLSITLDMGCLYQVESKQIPDFEDKLLSLLPGLYEHGCSRGKPGGLIERMREGTYISHITEHIILELLTQAGENVVWGKTFKSPYKDNTYILVVECPVKEAGEKAAQCAVELINGIINAKEVCVEKFIDEISYLNSEYGFGPSTAAIIRACKKRRIPVIPLQEGFVQLAYGKKQKRIFGTLTQNISCLACDIASDKSLAKQMMADIGLPVLPSTIVKNEKEALLAAQKIGYPVTIKPNNGNHGRGVSINLVSKAEVRAAYKLAYMHDKSIILEKYLSGRHYRILVVNGKFIACAQRVPAQICGDGKKTVRELIEDLNRDPRRGTGHGSIRSKIAIDAELIMTITKQKRTLQDILANGEVLILRENPNLSCGAGADDITHSVHPSFVHCAETAAKVIGLDIAGIDMVAEDITKPLNQQQAAIIEVNASPGLRMHLYPDNGQAQPVGDEIVKMLFPSKSSWHIPVVAVTGTNGKTTTTRMIGAILSNMGKNVGMTTTGGIFIGGNCICKGDTTGPESAKTVLKHPDVTAAVLETARGGILRSGLGYDLADVAVVTNITEDHLGQDGIETLDDLAHVKALVAEAVRPKGHVILNADDLYCTKIAQRVRVSIVYFSVDGNNRIICRHLAAGGEAYYVAEGNIIHAVGDKSEIICNINEIPITYGGRALHNVSNALAAIAAAASLGAPYQVIIDTLRNFGRLPQDNPGRLHIEEINKTTVIIDYGHNLAGYKWIAKFARTLSPKRLLGVVGVPGDRKNDSIIKVGAYAGKAFDKIWIKEDRDLRNRQPGEVANLLEMGAKKHLDEKDINICLQEIEAVEAALASSEPGDILIIFYEEFDPILNVVRSAQSMPQILEKTI